MRLTFPSAPCRLSLSLLAGAVTNGFVTAAGEEVIASSIKSRPASHAAVTRCSVGRRTPDADIRCSTGDQRIAGIDPCLTRDWVGYDVSPARSSTGGRRSNPIVSGAACDHLGRNRSS